MRINYFLYPYETKVFPLVKMSTKIFGVAKGYDNISSSTSSNDDEVQLPKVVYILFVFKHIVLHNLFLKWILWNYFKTF